MKVNQLKAGVLISYGTQVVHILTGLVYTPIMLRLLGKSEYGLYQLVYSVISYLSLLSLGFGTGYMRFYARYKAKEDEDGIARINGMFLLIFSVLAMVCLLAGGMMIWRADLVFGSGLTVAELSKARVLMVMMVVNMALSFVNSVFSCNVTAHERFFFQKAVGFLRALLNPFITLPLLLLGYGSIGVTGVATFLTVAVLCADAWYCLKKLRIRFSFTNFDFGMLKEMWVFTFFIFVNMITDQINWNVDKFLLGRIIGTGAVAVYGVAAQLNSLYITLASAVSAVFVPRVNMLVAKDNDNSVISALFNKVGRMQFLILALVVSGFCIFGREFIALWAGDGYEEAYYIGLLLMLPVTVPMIQNLGIEIQRAKNMHKTRSVVYLFVSVSNIFLSIPLICLLGATGAAVGTAVSLFVGNGLFMNWYYHKKIGINIIRFWREIITIVPATLVTCAIGIFLRMLLPVATFGGLFVAIGLYCIVYAICVWLFGANASERAMVSDMLRKLKLLK